jgi:hypothetical protein
MARACKRVGVAALVVGLVLAWATTCSATPDFPAVVVRALSLPGITFDPPQGCTLCHPTDAGGTSLSPFGALVRQDGASPYDESSLEQALAQVELDEPQLIDDIKAGRDPSADTGAANVHSPEYGCALGRGPAPEPLTMAGIVSVALLGSMARRARSWRPIQKLARSSAPPPPVSGAGATTTDALPSCGAGATR